MATSRTRSELVLAALEVLSSGVGNPVSAEDYSYVDGKVDGLIAALSTERIIDVSDPENIPIEWFNDLTADLIEECSPGHFGRKRDEDMRTLARGSLRRLSMSGPTYERLQVEYF